MTTAKKTASKKAAKTTPKNAANKRLTVTRNFIDRNGKEYKVGQEYQEISPERTKALMEAKVSELNRVGDIFLTEGE